MKPMLVVNKCKGCYTFLAHARPQAGYRTLGRGTLGRGTLGRERKTRVDSRSGDLHRVDSRSGALIACYCYAD